MHRPVLRAKKEAETMTRRSIPVLLAGILALTMSVSAQAVVGHVEAQRRQIEVLPGPRPEKHDHHLRRRWRRCKDLRRRRPGRWRQPALGNERQLRWQGQPGDGES